MDDVPDYSTWSPEALQAHIEKLEQKLKETTLYSPAAANAPWRRTANTAHRFRGKQPDKGELLRHYEKNCHRTRFVAFKFAYLGKNYHGLQLNNDPSAPTVEGELWKALMKTRLIFPKTKDGSPIVSVDDPPTWFGTDYSKCGRTDRGVSSFGQVIALRVKTKLPALWPSEIPQFPQSRKRSLDENGEPADHPNCSSDPSSPPAAPFVQTGGQGQSSSPETPSPPSQPIEGEIPYLQILNNVLPSSIRMLAWCPNLPPNFSARHDCKERRYRYFFTNPAFPPTPTGASGSTTASGRTNATGSLGNGRSRRATTGPLPAGWLDIDAMRTAAQHLVGSHDFRNFCSFDAARQLQHWTRCIFHVDIEALDPRKEPLGFFAGKEFGGGGIEEEEEEEHASTHPSADTSTDDMMSIDTEDAPRAMTTEHATTVPPPPRAPVRVPQVYAFNIHGSGFLYHQVRCIMAVLFLVGQGLEPPSIVAEMLDTVKTPCKPLYEMADDLPLVLADCIYPAPGSSSERAAGDALRWITTGATARQVDFSKQALKRILASGGLPSTNLNFGPGGVVPELWPLWRRAKMDELLAGALMDVVAAAGQGGRRGRASAADDDDEGNMNGRNGGGRGRRGGRGRSRGGHGDRGGHGMSSSTPWSTHYFQGGNEARPAGMYEPLLKRRFQERYEDLSARWLAKQTVRQQEKDGRERQAARAEVVEEHYREAANAIPVWDPMDG
ncbi:MAG: hypothetical protein M1822_007184 [Bathelium mastoideum]|nr:MAG: hypothetical protein M1822_007184 [Bathelium mastoideum]